MQIDSFITLNPWWDDSKFRFGTIIREQYLSKQNDRWVELFIGSRRVGKTSILQTIIDQLLEKEIYPKHIVYITGDVRLSSDFTLDTFIIEYKKKYNIKSGIYLFVDEIQEIADWPRSLKLLYDQKIAKIYATGSSSFLLQKETSKLTGRYVLQEVLPLSFQEYKKFKWLGTPKNALAKEAQLEEYLKSGGYPEYALHARPNMLNDIIDSILYRDLSGAYGLRNPKFLRDLVDYLSDKITNQVSPARIKADLKVNDETARHYLSYLQDAYLIHPVFRKGRSHKITKGSVPKYYFNDTGLLHARSQDPKIGHLAENAVYLELRRRMKYQEQPKIFYDIHEGQEIDFVTAVDKFEVKYRTDLTEEEIIPFLDYKNLRFLTKNVHQPVELVYPEMKFNCLYDFLTNQSSTS